jgi:lysophospholipase L1-like esterase
MMACCRSVARLVTMLVALAGPVMVGSLPAAAGSPGTVQYVALGDSFAAGQGAGSYLNSCLQSANGYPELLDAEKRIHLRANATCAGATTSDVADTQLRALNRGTRLVTLTVGGNDLNLSGVVTACTSGTQVDCFTAIERAMSLLRVDPTTGESVLGSRLTDLYARVGAAAPKALIVVTGYSLLFEPLDPGDPRAAIIAAVNAATTTLNDTIRQAVAATRATGVNIIYVDVTGGFAEHGIGSEQPFINATGPDAFHPNAAGYLAYAAAITAALPSAWVEGQKQAA